jgi:hypothetical protein
LVHGLAGQTRPSSSSWPPGWARCCASDGAWWGPPSTNWRGWPVAATVEAKRTARTAVTGAAQARQHAAEARAIHHRNHPPSRL